MERLGKVYRVAFDGPRILCLPHIIDNVVQKPGLGTPESQKVDISSREGQEVDFTDGSAPIKGSSWFTVGNPDTQTHEDLVTNIVEFAYVYQNPLERIAEVLIEFAREHLQGLSIDEAQKEAKKLPTALMSPEGELTRDSVLRVGAYLDNKRPLIISDIDLPIAIQTARQKSLDAKRDADVFEKLAGGYAGAVRNLMEAARQSGQTLSFGQAYEIFFQQRALDTVGKAQSISFIAPNMDGVLKTVVVGSTPTGTQAPAQTPTPTPRGK